MDDEWSMGCDPVQAMKSIWLVSHSWGNRADVYPIFTTLLQMAATQIAIALKGGLALWRLRCKKGSSAESEP